MGRKSGPSIIILLGLVAGLMPATAHAHRLNVFAYVLDDEVHVEAYFARGAMAHTATVKVFGADDAFLVEGQTGEDGTFAFPLPGDEQELRITVNSGDAHQGTFTLALDGNAEPAAVDEQPTEAVDTSDVSSDELRRVEEKLTAVQRQLVDLQRDLHEYESRVSLDRVLAGIGFIVGVTGVSAFLLARHKMVGKAHGD